MFRELNISNAYPLLVTTCYSVPESNDFVMYISISTSTRQNYSLQTSSYFRSLKKDGGNAIRSAM